MKQMICICCPLGCRLSVERTKDGYIVEGNTCKRGRDYAIDELTAPKRTVTTSALVSGGTLETVSVKTASAVPKQRMFEVVAAVKSVTVNAPVKRGDVIIKDVCGMGCDIVATRTVEAGSAEEGR